MLTRLIAFMLLLGGIYTLSVFLIPDITDQYGNQYINTKIRDIKYKSLNFASGSDSAASIRDKILHTSQSVVIDIQKGFASGSSTAESIIDTTQVLIDEGKRTFINTEKILTEKTEQAQKVVESAQKLYEATEQAKRDFDALTSPSSTTQSQTGGNAQ